MLPASRNKDKIKELIMNRSFNSTFRIFLLILLFLPILRILSEEPVKVTKSNQLLIEEFTPKDISKDIYKIKVNFL